MKRKAESRHLQRSAVRGGGLRNISKKSHPLEFPPANEPLDDSSEESEVDTDEEKQRDRSMYHTLLSSLKSSCGSFAHVYDKRQREQEGVSSAEEDEQDTELESESDVSGDAKVEEVGTEPMESSEEEIVESEEDQDIEGTAGQLAVDDEDDIEDDDKDGENNEASTSISSFKLHTTHTLAEADVQKLKEGKRKFKAEFPAHGMPLCKWTTTNDSLHKEDDRLASYGVQSRLQKHWQSIHKKPDCGDFTSAKQSQFFSLCNSYQDILHSNKNAFFVWRSR